MGEGGGRGDSELRRAGDREDEGKTKRKGDSRATVRILLPSVQLVITSQRYTLFESPFAVSRPSERVSLRSKSELESAQEDGDRAGGRELDKPSSGVEETYRNPLKRETRTRSW